MLDVRHHVPRELTISVVTLAHVALRVRALDSWTTSRLKSAISDILGTQYCRHLLTFNGKPIHYNKLLSSMIFLSQ